VEVLQPDNVSPLDTRRILGTLWRQRWWILATTLLCGAVAFAGAARSTERYQTSARILISEPPAIDLPFVTQSLSEDPERRLQTELELIESRSMRERIAELTGRQLSVDAATSGDSDVIVLTADGADPDQLADDVNDVASSYTRLRQEDLVLGLQEGRQRVAQELRVAQRSLFELVAPIAQLDSRIAATPAGVDRDLLVQERDALQDRVGSQQVELNRQVAQYQDLLASIDGLTETAPGGVEVISEAGVPSEPYFPQPRKDTLVGLSIGLLLGLAVAFTREHLLDRIVGDDQLEAALPGDPVLGILPHIDDFEGETVPLLIRSEAPDLLGAEAYRSLAASIEFAHLGKPVTVIHVTSALASEGKSTTAANLATAFAESGTKTLILDADLRRPTLHRYFATDNDQGLSAILAGRCTVAEAVQPVVACPGLHVLSPGPLPPNPTRLLYARRTEDLFDELRAGFDVVIIDSPPVLPVADALILAQFADLVLLVARSEVTRRRMLRRARKALSRVESHQVAAALNGMAASGPLAYTYGYGQGYGYGQEQRRRDRPAGA